jgi:hypothetical protein
MFQFLRDYTKLPKHILFVLGAEFFLQLINSSFLSNLPLFMHAEHYSDGQIADAIKYRYLGVLTSALFVGIYIRRRKLMPLFFVACSCVPVFAVGILYSVHLHNTLLNHSMQVLWGASFTCMQIPVLPFILRNSDTEHHTTGISLSYATWSAATILASVVFSSFNYANPDLFTESRLLYGMVACSFIGLFLVSKVKLTEHIPPVKTHTENSFHTDRGLIIKALIPTLIIAVGAGFTIPFISLFFTTVHHLSNPAFNLTNLVASILILFAALLVPKIKKSIGYQVAIPTTQSLAIIALILMATTQYYSQLGISVYIAIGCFLLRQPLMNLAGPMTSEVVMKYVGKRNQEVVSALTAAIWSGSWFFSGLIFGILRDGGVDYVNIFLITAALYSIGVVWYSLLVRDYERRQKSGLIEI